MHLSISSAVTPIEHNRNNTTAVESSQDSSTNNDGWVKELETRAATVLLSLSSPSSSAFSTSSQSLRQRHQQDADKLADQAAMHGIYTFFAYATWIEERSIHVAVHQGVWRNSDEFWKLVQRSREDEKELTSKEKTKVNSGIEFVKAFCKAVIQAELQSQLFKICTVFGKDTITSTPLKCSRNDEFMKQFVKMAHDVLEKKVHGKRKVTSKDVEIISKQCGLHHTNIESTGTSSSPERTTRAARPSQLERAQRTAPNNSDCGRSRVRTSRERTLSAPLSPTSPPSLLSTSTSPSTASSTTAQEYESDGDFEESTITTMGLAETESNTETEIETRHTALNGRTSHRESIETTATENDILRNYCNQCSVHPAVSFPDRDTAVLRQAFELLYDCYDITKGQWLEPTDVNQKLVKYLSQCGNSRLRDSICASTSKLIRSVFNCQTESDIVALKTYVLCFKSFISEMCCESVTAKLGIDSVICMYCKYLIDKCNPANVTPAADANGLPQLNGMGGDRTNSMYNHVTNPPIVIERQIVVSHYRIDSQNEGPGNAIAKSLFNKLPMHVQLKMSNSIIQLQIQLDSSLLPPGNVWFYVVPDLSHDCIISELVVSSYRASLFYIEDGIVLESQAATDVAAPITAANLDSLNELPLSTITDTNITRETRNSNENIRWKCPGYAIGCTFQADKFDALHQMDCKYGMGRHNPTTSDNNDQIPDLDYVEEGRMEFAIHSKFGGVCTRAVVDLELPQRPASRCIFTLPDTCTYLSEDEVKLLTTETSRYSITLDNGKIVDLRHHWVGKINHGPSRIANVEFFENKVIQIRPIHKGEEVLMDYGVNYWTSQVTGMDIDDIKKKKSGNGWRQIKATLSRMWREVTDYTPLLTMRNQSKYISLDKMITEIDKHLKTLATSWQSTETRRSARLLTYVR